MLQTILVSAGLLAALVLKCILLAELFRAQEQREMDQHTAMFRE